MRVPLATVPLDIWGSLQAGRRNVLKLILEIAARPPILSGTTARRWPMVMDPEALRHFLRDGVENYPKSLVTKLILKPAIGNSMFVAEGADWHWQRRTGSAGLFASQHCSPCPRDDRRRTRRDPLCRSLGLRYPCL